MTESRDSCPICLSKLAKSAFLDEPATSYDCPRCGVFELSWELAVGLSNEDLSATQRAIASHAVRRMQSRRRTPRLLMATWDRILETSTLPNPSSQAQNLLEFLGNEAQAPGHSVDLRYLEAAAIVGALDTEGVMFILDALQKKELIVANSGAEATSVRLSYSGWQSFEQLTRGQAAGRKAFMAMSYSNEELERVFLDHFKPAAQRAGFVLSRLDDEPRAGSIDNRMRVEIRASQFIVADLTDTNPGAYWEAGYAEGLGKPVIYSCEQGVWESEGTHFDTAHLQTVIWDADDAEKAGRDLLATIRATLPEIAIVSDDE